MSPSQRPLDNLASYVHGRKLCRTEAWLERGPVRFPVADFAASVLAKALVMLIESFTMRLLRAVFALNYSPRELATVPA
jgi:hypothetical protein